MTEKEAIYELEGLKDSLDGLPPETGVSETYAALNMAIKALEEIQQYRDIGTAENIKRAINILSIDNEKDIVKRLDELNDYRKI